MVPASLNSAVIALETEHSPCLAAFENACIIGSKPLKTEVSMTLCQIWAPQEKFYRILKSCQDS